MIYYFDSDFVLTPLINIASIIRVCIPQSIKLKIFIVPKFILYFKLMKLLITNYFYSIGPLVSFWCMRMEAKHSYFKKAAQISTYFKNVPYSVARRHQKLRCGLLQGNFISYNELEYGPCM